MFASTLADVLACLLASVLTISFLLSTGKSIGECAWVGTGFGASFLIFVSECFLDFSGIVFTILGFGLSVSDCNGTSCLKNADWPLSSLITDCVLRTFLLMRITL